MSHYSEIDVEFHHKDCLLESLMEMGMNFQEYQTAEALEDYQGHKRQDTKAHIIVSRKNFPNSLVNDIGFAVDSDGKVTKSYIDEFFQKSNVKGKFLNPLSQKYAEKVTRKTASRMKLRVTGEEKLEDGTIRLRLKR